MTLDEQLRAALSQEADMQTVPRPDIDELISGGRELKRHRNRGRIGVAAAVAAVLVAGGTYVATLDDPVTKGEPAQTSEPSESAAPQPMSLDGEPGLETGGRYRMLVGGGGSGAALQADVTIEGAGWSNGNFPMVTRGATHGGVAVYVPQGLAAGSGCESEEPELHVASNVADLAEQLAQLPGSTVVQAATRQKAFGRDAIHLRLRIVDNCPSGSGYRLAETPRGSHGISVSDIYNEILVDFWVLEVDGVPVVVDVWYQDIASDRVIRQLMRTRDSITFTTDQ